MAKNADIERSVHADASSAALINEVKQYNTNNAEIASRQMEMMHRVDLTLRAFNAASDRWSSRLFWLTVVLAFLSVVLVVFGGETMYLAWVTLERMR